MDDPVDVAPSDEASVSSFCGVLKVSFEHALLVSKLASKTTPPTRVISWRIPGDGGGVKSKFLTALSEVPVLRVVNSLVFVHPKPLTDRIH